MATVVVNQSVPVGPEAVHVTCPHCHASIRSTVKHEASTKTHIAAVLLCLIFFPCVCVPYCMDSCRNTNHYCPNCNAFLGTYSS